MKRVLAFLFAFLMLTACAYADEAAEITYQGIPWGSSVETMKKWAKDQGFKVVAEHTSSPSYLDAEGKFTQSILMMNTSNTGCTIVTAQQNSAFQVAGYDVSSLGFCFDTVDGKPALATVTVSIDPKYDRAQALDDLKQKLAQVYGENECTTEPKANSFMPSYVSLGERYFKQGANNTAVCLTYPGGSVTIVYGKTDAFADQKESQPVTVSPYNFNGL